METGIGMAKQILSIQKTMIDNSLKAQVFIQEQGERMARAAFAPAGGWPAESEQLWRNWSEALQEGRNSFQALVDVQFDMLDRLLNPIRR
jgi:hypothetical protein